MRARLLVHGAAAGAWNMAVDEALMSASGEGSPPVLRFYRWEPFCLSLGRHERAREFYDPAAAALRGIEIVRRPTGGRAVYHGPELTYSVTAPIRMWGGLKESYRRINLALSRGLSRLGVPIDGTGTAGEGPSPPGSAPSGAGRGAGVRETPRVRRLDGRACFADPAPGEVTVGGRKLIGSAQWRANGVLLQHGSLLLRDAQATVAELGRQPVRRRAEPASIGLDDACGLLPPLADLVEALVEGFAEEFGLALEPSRLTPGERARATALLDRYASAAWTWRR